ncbi:S-protein homolog 26-like [Eutrema salsugineum]|uniref:S-protein homolog 26-like n=1 Tax=Eutrema salsugineum TaxID=72664 RepID=UPI000CED45EA|nr:S-protein homolog 26-like [Eutrema salsugineum]
MMMSNTALSGHTRTVWITNFLPNQKELIVRCKSEYVDNGYHRVLPTRPYSLRYKEGECDDCDRVWCHLWQGPDFKHHKDFEVDNGNVWEAREDGVYLSVNQRPAAFVYSWDVASILSSRASSLGSSLSLLWKPGELENQKAESGFTFKYRIRISRYGKRTTRIVVVKESSN